MLAGFALKPVNHLLTHEAWARNKLAAFAGQTARFEFAGFALPIRIATNGLFETDDEAGAAAAVTIRFPDDTPVRALVDRPSLFAAANIAGSAELAETLGMVFRNLHWDAESDLSRLFGDIVGRRLLLGGKALAAWNRQRLRNVSHNLAEYLTAEASAIAQRTELTRFSSDVDSLDRQFARCEARLLKLESR